MPAGIELCVLSLTGTLLFVVDTPGLIAVAVMALSLGRGARSLAAAMRGLAVVLVLLVAFHGLLNSWWAGLDAALRIGALAALGFLLTLTTPLDALLAVPEAALRPLRLVGLRPERLALSFGLMNLVCSSGAVDGQAHHLTLARWQRRAAV